MGCQVPVGVSRQHCDTAPYSNADMTREADYRLVDMVDIDQSDNDEVHVTHGDSLVGICYKHVTHSNWLVRLHH